MAIGRTRRDRLSQLAGIIAGFVGLPLFIGYFTDPGKARKLEEIVIPYLPDRIAESLKPIGGIDGLSKIEQADVNFEKEYLNFKYPNEIPDIIKHAERIGVEPEMLMAVRMAENGVDRLAYGIMPQGSAKERYEGDKGYRLNGEFFEYRDEREKQLCWAAWTIKKNFDRFRQNPEGHEDFISYLAGVYAPTKAENDPKNLNANWEKNVRRWYKEFNDG